MITKLFTVYDQKAETYMQPFAMQSTGQAARTFEDTVNDPTHAFNKHPEDYTLFEIGRFDDNTAELEMLPTPIALAKAIECITTGTQS